MARRFRHVAAHVVFAVILVSLSWTRAEAQSLTYSAVDRATVRVFSVKGVMALGLRNPAGLERVIAIPNAGHGTGVAISPDGLVLTADHVVADAHLLAVRVPGDDIVYPAEIVHRDPDHDFALLAVPTHFDNSLEVGEEVPTLHVRQTVHAVGYPLDPRRTEPQSSRGIIAGVMADGNLQLDMSLNPGNSGGPLIDEQEHLVGIVVARGDPERGVQGIGVAVPLGPIAAALQDPAQPDRLAAARQRLEAVGQRGRDIARFVNTLVPLGTIGLLQEMVEVVDEARQGAVLEQLRELTAQSGSADLDALAAAYLWDVTVMSLEHAGGVPWVDRLPAGPERDRVIDHVNRAIHLSHRSVRADASVVDRSPFVRWIVEHYSDPGAPVNVSSPAGGASPPAAMRAATGASVAAATPAAPATPERPTEPMELPSVIGQLSAGLLQAASSDVAVGGGHAELAGQMVVWSGGEEEDRNRVALLLGAALAVGGWAADVSWALALDAGVAVRIGRAPGFYGLAAWAPGVLSGRQGASVTGAGYRLDLGIALGSWSVGVGWRGMQRQEDYAMHSLRLFVGWGL